MSGPLILLAVGGMTAAALCAVADGALLAEALPVGPGAEPPDPGRTVRVERAHRSLAAARVVAQLVVGAAIAAVVAPGDAPGAAALAAGLGLGLLAVVLSEGVARMLGDAMGPAAVQRLDGVVGTAELLMAPVVRVGAWLDRQLAAVLAEPESSVERREAAAAQFRDVIASEADVSRDER